jgi:N-methylhydantoinase A
VVTLRVDATGWLPKPTLARLPRSSVATDTVIGYQALHLDGEVRATSCSMHDRARMGPGTIVQGPAIIVQFDCTTVLLPGQRAEVDDYGILVVREC